VHTQPELEQDISEPRCFFGSKPTSPVNVTKNANPWLSRQRNQKRRLCWMWCWYSRVSLKKTNYRHGQRLWLGPKWKFVQICFEAPFKTWLESILLKLSVRSAGSEFQIVNNTIYKLMNFEKLDLPNCLLHLETEEFKRVMHSICWWHGWRS